MDDEDLLAGVPEDAAIAGDDDTVLLGETDTTAAALAAEVGVEAAMEETEETEETEAGEAAAGPKLKKFSGKRKIIQHAWPADLSMGINPDSEEEQAKRAARAAKFGAPTAAAPEVSEEERAKREARAAKFGLAASVSAAEKAAEALAPPTAKAEPAPVVTLLTAEEVAERQERAKRWGTDPRNPIESIVSSAPKGTFWEKRRDAAADEPPRAEAAHIFGVDKMSSEDLLRFWVAEGVPCPTHVEWVNDSSANVVFGSADDAAAALRARTVPLLPGQEELDTATWRTLPLHLAAAGKGLQLLFRLATFKDVKPPKRAPSRWYGEVTKKGQPLARGGTGKADARADKRGARKQAANPYSKGGTLAAKLRAANERELAGDLRSRLAQGSRPAADKQELAPDLRARIAARQAAPEAEGAGFSYADFKRKRAEKAAAEEEDEDDEMGGEVDGRGADQPTGLFGYAQAKAELGLGAGGEEAAPPSGSSVGVGVAPAEGGGMDVEDE